MPIFRPHFGQSSRMASLISCGQKHRQEATIAPESQACTLRRRFTNGENLLLPRARKDGYFFL
jgi:hypothetical protein